MSEYQINPKKLATLASAWSHWEKNPHLQKQELFIQFGIHRKEFNQWMKDNNKSRPDGRLDGKDSPRQQAIREAYAKAIEAKQNMAWAVAYARKTCDSIRPPELRYYAMKNDLAPLEEPAPQRSVADKYKDMPL